ncbi:hypothetical protein STEG23_023582, partial [Scotinomys teguina]
CACLQAKPESDGCDQKAKILEKLGILQLAGGLVRLTQQSLCVILGAFTQEGPEDPKPPVLSTGNLMGSLTTSEFGVLARLSRVPRAFTQRSQHPHGSLQLPKTSVPGNLMPSSGLFPPDLILLFDKPGGGSWGEGKSGKIRKSPDRKRVSQVSILSFLRAFDLHQYQIVGLKRLPKDLLHFVTCWPILPATLFPVNEESCTFHESLTERTRHRLPRESLGTGWETHRKNQAQTSKGKPGNGLETHRKNQAQTSKGKPGNGLETHRKNQAQTSKGKPGNGLGDYKKEPGTDFQGKAWERAGDSRKNQAQTSKGKPGNGLGDYKKEPGTDFQGKAWERAGDYRKNQAQTSKGKPGNGLGDYKKEPGTDFQGKPGNGLGDYKKEPGTDFQGKPGNGLGDSQKEPGTDFQGKAWERAGDYRAECASTTGSSGVLCSGTVSTTGSSRVLCSGTVLAPQGAPGSSALGLC